MALELSRFSTLGSPPKPTINSLQHCKTKKHNHNNILHLSTKLSSTKHTSQVVFLSLTTKPKDQNREKEKVKMAGNSMEKKPSFSLFSLFKGKSSRPRRGDDYRDEYVKAYKVYPSDEDRGRWVAEPGIDKKASAYISLTTDKWEKLAVAN